MNSFKICLACLLLTLVAGACTPSNAAAVASPSSTPLPTATTAPTLAPTPTLVPLSADMLRNMQYDLPVSKKSVKLTDGKYQAGSGADFLAVGMADPIGFGDMNGDGTGDAAVVLGENTGGSGTFESLVVVLNQGGEPAQAAAVQIGDRVRVNAVTIQNGRVTVDETVQGPQDPMCCPSEPVTETFRMTHGGLFLDRLTSKTPQGEERAIHIDSPGDGTQVADAVQVKGSETIAPFENSLVYRIYDENNQQLAEGPLSVKSSGTGGLATFDTTLDVSKAPPGATFWLEVMDLSPADGATQALSSVELVRK